ncbi:MAG: hypothetical protein L6Q57_09105 [Alphaproteobacteria bacterium]|nr:hypothetical protein [Alphaproteobacteria bacterium]
MNPSHLNARRLIRICAFAIGIFLAALTVFYLSHVPRAITASDRAIFETKIDLRPSSAPEDYASQIRQIRNIQRAIFRASPGTAPIAYNQEREPSNLFLARHGECFDRSRTLDKALRFVGYETRYASLYARPSAWPAWRVILHEAGPDMRSHALIEVHTALGWMFIDSVTPFLALDRNDAPVSLAAWQAQPDKHKFLWQEQPNARLYPLMQKDFIFVYGLYSRHGRAYPPYFPIPDVNWPELLWNL